jgi:hypothetical protein
MSELETKTEIKMGSERSFGIVFAIVFVIIGLFPLFWGNGPRLWSMGVAAIFLALAFLRPSVLAVPNRLWFRFGLFLNKIFGYFAICVGGLFSGHASTAPDVVQ